MTRTEKIIAAHVGPGTPESRAAIITELRRLARLADAYWREVGQWRIRNEAMKMVGADPYPWPDLDLARDATDAARREAGEGQ